MEGTVTTCSPVVNSVKAFIFRLFNTPLEFIVTTLSVEAPLLSVDAVIVPLNVALLLNVFAPAIVCVPVVTKPLAVADASGMLNVCVVLLEEILKSVPEVPVANVCVVPVNPFKLVMPEPLPPERGVHTGLAVVPVFTLNTLSVVLKISRPLAGKTMAFCCVVVIRGAKKPLVVLLMSSIALVSG